MSTAVWIALGAAALFVALVVWLRRGTAPPSSNERTRANDDDARDDDDFRKLDETVVVLSDNLWDACEIDGLREPWARFTSKPTRGLASVPAGRHRVSTRTQAGDAVLDFTLHPGEVFVRRLDASGGRWVREKRETESELRARAKGGPRGAMAECLLSYKTAVGIARVAQGTVRAPDRAIEEALGVLEPLLDRMGTDHDADGLEAARRAGAALVGVPLTTSQLSRLRRAIVARAIAALAAGSVVKARATLDLGLVVLPGEPGLEAELERLEVDDGKA